MRWAPPTRPPEQAVLRFDELVRGDARGLPENERDALGRTPVAGQLDAGVLDQSHAGAHVFVDDPEKIRRGRFDAVRRPNWRLIE